MARLINLTPHVISIFATKDCEEVVMGSYKTLTVKEGATPSLELPPSGEVARASEVTEKLAPMEVGGFNLPIIHKEMGEAYGLPPEEEGVFLVVSLATAKAAPDRHDLLMVGESVRDSANRIRGCISLARP